MSRVQRVIVAFLFVFMVQCVGASHNFDYTVSSRSGDLDETIPWCVEMGITSTALKTLQIPAMEKLDNYIEIYQKYFHPNEIVPHQKLVVNIGGNGDSHYTMDEVELFFNNADNVAAVVAWLQELTFQLNALHPDNGRAHYRFRFFNEVNAFNTFSSETLYYALSRFYPLFKEYGPQNSSLVLSLAAGESDKGEFDIDANNYQRYIERFLIAHNASGSDTLPVDGMDLHGGSTYNYWSSAYRKTQRLFVELLPNGEDVFNEMVFWSLETCRTTRGMTSYIWANKINEYHSDWDAVRIIIKTMAHVLNIPQMEFTALEPERPEWELRYGNDLFASMGLFDHGCLVFDKGTKTPIYGSEGLKKFTNYINGYYPDTPHSDIFNTSNVRRYQFKTPDEDDKYRLVVWRDHGNSDLENQVVQVPFTRYSYIYELDLITGNTRILPVWSGKTGNWVSMTLNDNPKLLTPSLENGQLVNRYYAIAHSDVTDIQNFSDGQWTSDLHLCNPTGEILSIEVVAYSENGQTMGIPYETSIPANGMSTLSFADIFPAFNGFVTIDSSNRLLGQIEHRLCHGNLNHGVMTHVSQIGNLEDDFLAETKYMSIDWEVDESTLNTLTLTNLSEDTAVINVITFDETGAQEDALSLSLGDKNQITIPINKNATMYRYGQLLIESPPGIFGKLTRSNSNALWDDVLFDDSHLMTEIELKNAFIPETQSYARIIVSNPWSDSVSGDVIATAKSGEVISTTPVTIAGGETFELSTTDSSVDSICLKLSNQVKVFGRKEEVQASAGATLKLSSENAGSTRSQTGKFLLPYLIHDKTSTNHLTTTLVLENNTKLDVKAHIKIFNHLGDIIESFEQTLPASDVSEISLSDKIPTSVLILEGSVEVNLPDMSGIKIRAVYASFNSTGGSELSMSSSLCEYK